MTSVPMSPASPGGSAAPARTGVLGQSWRAEVTAWGGVVPDDGTPPLEWHIAADDRWHTPAAEVAVRQTRLSGAPVFETRMRIPGGDVVHRVWSVADGGGRTIVEVTNDSPLPIACAFTRSDLATVRPPTDVPIQGIELPARDTTMLPIGHRSTVTVGLAHVAPAPSRLPAVSSADAVARGWVAITERAGRLVLPDDGLVATVVCARSDLLLGGLSAPDADPVGFLLGVAELVRMGELDAAAVARLTEDVAVTAEGLAIEPGWDVDAALDAAAVALGRVGERRAVRDLGRISAGRSAQRAPVAGADGVRAVAAVERRLARGGVLFPDGYPPEWRGAGLEAHALPVGPTTTVSFAVRWHGEHPAVLWQLDGDRVELTAPTLDPQWRSSASSGEALLRLQ